MEDKRCAIFYFSGTGNTAWLARRLASALTQGGMATSAVSIEGLSPQDAKEAASGCGHIGFAYPIYGSDVPEPMKAFLRNLPPLGDRTYFGLCTQEMFSGDGVRVMESFLRASQGPVRIAFARHFVMPNNISIEKYGFRVTNDPAKLAPVFEKAAAKADGFARDILLGRRVRQGMNPGSMLLGLIQRGPFRGMYSWLMGSLTIDQNRCIGCDTCRRICPMENIQGTLGSSDYEAGRNCCLCLRCYNYCPADAVLYLGTRAKGKPYQGPEGTLEELLERSK